MVPVGPATITGMVRTAIIMDLSRGRLRRVSTTSLALGTRLLFHVMLPLTRRTVFKKHSEEHIHRLLPHKKWWGLRVFLKEPSLYRHLFCHELVRGHSRKFPGHNLRGNQHTGIMATGTPYHTFIAVKAP